MMLKKTIKRINYIRRNEKNLFLLFSAGLLIVIGLQLIQPLFPVYLQSINASELEISLVISLSSIAGTALMLPSGYIMDRLGKKKMFQIGILLWGFSTLLISFARNWRTVAFLYIFHGIADAFVGPARMAFISSASTQASEATVFGLMSLDWTIGGTIAPPVSGFLSEKIGWHIPLFIASIMFFLGIIPVVAIKEKPSLSPTKENPDSKNMNIKVPFLTTFLYFMFGFLTNSAQSMVGTMLPLFLNNELKTTITSIGLFFTASHVIGTIVQVPGGLLADRYGRKKLITLLLLPVPLLYGLWGIVDKWYAYLLIYVISGGLLSMISPASLAIVSEVFPREKKGFAFGLRMAGIRLGSATGPLLGGYLYGSSGSSSPFICAGVVLLFSIPFIYFLKKRHN
ncbi:arabinose efflux permease family protein [Thaumarchaeota archaeon SCGC AB-539-E09]|nr:arabinose efflux permease family protein [Thaumarchaeota archaeon SCGC AB-539-E09]